MSDLHDLAGAYAVDALDPAERQAFERHLANCSACRAEVSALRESAASLSHVSAVAPPPALRNAVLEGIQRVRPLAAETVVATQDAGTAPGAGSPRHAADPGNVVQLRRRRVAVWLAGAAAAAAVAIGAVVWSPWDTGSHRQVSATQQVLQAKDAQRFTGTVAGARATIVRSPSLGRAVLVAENLPSAPVGKDYQLWYKVPGKGFVSAGVVHHDASGPLTFVLSGDARTATAAGITIEPTGGSPSPTMQPIAAFGFA